MKCSQQWRYALNKANKVLPVGMMIKGRLLKIMFNLYKTLVRPHVEYCVSAWSPHYKKDKELLEKAQQRFTKMIKGMKGRERLQKLNLWSLEERRNRQDLIEVFKFVKDLVG